MWTSFRESAMCGSRRVREDVVRKESCVDEFPKERMTKPATRTSDAEMLSSSEMCRQNVV